MLSISASLLIGKVHSRLFQPREYLTTDRVCQGFDQHIKIIGFYCGAHVEHGIVPVRSRLRRGPSDPLLRLAQPLNGYRTGVS